MLASEPTCLRLDNVDEPILRTAFEALHLHVPITIIAEYVASCVSARGFACGLINISNRVNRQAKGTPYRRPKGALTQC